MRPALVTILPMLAAAVLVTVGGERMARRDPFERVFDTTNEGASGTGLGLAIGCDLAARMQGTLELLDSEQGATFRLRIPAPPALALVSYTDSA